MADATAGSGAGQRPPNNFCERYGPGGSVPWAGGGGSLQCNGNDPTAVSGCEAVCHQCCADGYPGGGSDYSDCYGCCDAYNNGTNSTQHCVSAGAKPVSSDS